MMQISIRNLCCAFNGRAILKGINMEIEQGQFVSIVGRSGCGKSTLLNCIAGFVEKSDGVVSGRNSFGFVFQNHSLYPFMTSRENIALGLGHLSPDSRRARVDEYLEIVGLAAFGDRYPWQLSGGESQRVAIARAFAPEPEIVLMDEPFSSLDVIRRESMMEWLLEFLRNRTTTVMLVTHWIDEAIIPADRVVVLSDGVAVADVEVLLPRPRNGLTIDHPEFAGLRARIRSCIFSEHLPVLSI